MNYAHYEGKGINVPEIIDLAETMPFFAEKRLIVIEDSGLFKNADAKFADYIKSMPETVCFVSVSYTHLDVYKRQDYNCRFFLSESG